MAVSTNEIELVLRFYVSSSGAAEGHQYTAKHTSSDCEW